MVIFNTALCIVHASIYLLMATRSCVSHCTFCHDF